jgi:hypothetical protein
MKTLYQSLLLTLGALAFAGTAFAQVPSSNDTSDESGNTGMGYAALGGPAATNGGAYNTASGAGTLASNTNGNSNTADGATALQNNTIGSANTATGFSVLITNTTGNNNTATGYMALYANSDGNYNAAFGDQSLFMNNASNNTAVGHAALYNNTTGYSNTATGTAALFYNAGGWDNTATGFTALNDNTTGSYNTASGYEALYSNTDGNYNNASGYLALHDNTSGSQNSASGVQALFTNKTGNFNTASGTDALYSNTTGSTNIAEGYKAGYNLTTGSNNIDIGNLGVAAESGTIRIGTTSTQTKTFIAGVYGTSVTGSTVVVSSTGQLGVTVSSERFKTAIAPMGADTAKLVQLRPVSFKLKSDTKGTRQYGLIAEEVAEVYPELVIRDEKGGIDGVRYDELAPMLLNEVQKQQQKNAAQELEIRDLKQQVAELKNLKQEWRAALLKLRANDDSVAQR